MAWTPPPGYELLSDPEPVAAPQSPAWTPPPGYEPIAPEVNSLLQEESDPLLKTAIQSNLPKPDLTDFMTAARRESQALKVKPEEYLSALLYESPELEHGNYWQKGPVTKWGQHHGAFQWGEPQAKQYGVGPDTPISDQLGAGTKYLLDRGFKPGEMGLLDFYSTINAGRPGRYGASDRPGATVASHVNKMMSERLPIAQRLLQEYPEAPAWTPPEGYELLPPETPETPVAATEAPKPGFVDSMARGVDVLEQLTAGGLEAVGEATGWESLTAAARAEREAEARELENQPRTSVFDGDPLQWAKETIGEQLPIMAPSMAGALGGGVLGAPAGPLGATIGAAIGAFIPSAILGTGETQVAMKEKDPNVVAPGYAFLGGTAIGALDTALPGYLGSKLVRAFGKEMAEEIAKETLQKPLAARIAKGAATGSLIEGGTEYVQEVISEVASSKGVGKDIDWTKAHEQGTEAGAAGALLGGVFGGAAGVAPEKKAVEQPRDLEVQPPVKEDRLALPNVIHMEDQSRPGASAPFVQSEFDQSNRRPPPPGGPANADEIVKSFERPTQKFGSIESALQHKIDKFTPPPGYEILPKTNEAEPVAAGSAPIAPTPQVTREVASTQPLPETAEKGKFTPPPGYTMVSEGLAAAPEKIGREHEETKARAASDKQAARVERARVLKQFLTEGKGKLTSEDIWKHPAMVAANEEDVSVRSYDERTLAKPLFQNTRVIDFSKQKQAPHNKAVVGYRQARKHLDDMARSYSTEGPVAKERKAIVLIGGPGAGKSTLGRKLAAKLHAAIVDPDDISPMLPGFEDAPTSVHNEAAILATEQSIRLMTAGDNLVLPRSGMHPDGIRRWVARLRAQGYAVDLVHVDVDDDVAAWRQANRYLEDGRFVSPTYARGGGSKALRTYIELRKEGVADRYAQVDTTEEGQDPVLSADGKALEDFPGLYRHGDQGTRSRVRALRERREAEARERKKELKKAQKGAAGQIPARPKPKGPEDILSFVARLGGMQDETGELAAAGMPRWRGYMGVISKRGMPSDKMREAAVEAGYLQEIPGEQATTTLDDLRDLIYDAFNNKKKIYPKGAEGHVSAYEQKNRDKEEADEIDRLAFEVEAEIAKDDPNFELKDHEKRRAAQLRAEGMDAHDIMERISQESIEEHLDEVSAASPRSGAKAKQAGAPQASAGQAKNGSNLRRKARANTGKGGKAQAAQGGKGALDDIPFAAIPTSRAWVRPSDKTLSSEFEREIKSKGLSRLYATEEAFVAAVKAGQVVTVTPEIGSKIGNRSHTKSKKALIGLLSSYRSWPQYRNESTTDNLYSRMQAGQELDMPLVYVGERGQMRVISGNTRMDVAEQLGIEPQVIMFGPGVEKGLAAAIPTKRPDGTQQEIPGTAKDEAGLLKLKAKAPLKGKVAQEGPESLGGLFGDAKKQGALFAAVPTSIPGWKKLTKAEAKKKGHLDWDGVLAAWEADNGSGWVRQWGDSYPEPFTYGTGSTAQGKAKTFKEAVAALTGEAEEPSPFAEPIDFPEINIDFDEAFADEKPGLDRELKKQVDGWIDYWIGHENWAGQTEGDKTDFANVAYDYAKKAPADFDEEAMASDIYKSIGAVSKPDAEVLAKNFGISLGEWKKGTEAAESEDDAWQRLEAGDMMPNGAKVMPGVTVWLKDKGYINFTHSSPHHYGYGKQWEASTDFAPSLEAAKEALKEKGWVEPTMQEILASINKIIGDQDAKDAAKAKPGGTWKKLSASEKSDIGILDTDAYERHHLTAPDGSLIAWVGAWEEGSQAWGNYKWAAGKFSDKHDGTATVTVKNGLPDFATAVDFIEQYLKLKPSPVADAAPEKAESYPELERLAKKQAAWAFDNGHLASYYGKGTGAIKEAENALFAHLKTMVGKKWTESSFTQSILDNHLGWTQAASEKKFTEILNKLARGKTADKPKKIIPEGFEDQVAGAKPEIDEAVKVGWKKFTTTQGLKEFPKADMWWMHPEGVSKGWIIHEGSHYWYGSGPTNSNGLKGSAYSLWGALPVDAKPAAPEVAHYAWVDQTGNTKYFEDFGKVLVSKTLQGDDLLVFNALEGAPDGKWESGWYKGGYTKGESNEWKTVLGGYDKAETEEQAKEALLKAYGEATGAKPKPSVGTGHVVEWAKSYQYSPEYKLSDKEIAALSNYAVSLVEKGGVGNNWSENYEALKNAPGDLDLTLKVSVDDLIAAVKKQLEINKSWESDAQPVAESQSVSDALEALAKNSGIPADQLKTLVGKAIFNDQDPVQTILSADWILDAEDKKLVYAYAAASGYTKHAPKPKPIDPKDHPDYQEIYDELYNEIYDEKVSDLANDYYPQIQWGKAETQEPDSDYLWENARERLSETSELESFLSDLGHEIEVEETKGNYKPQTWKWTWKEAGEDYDGEETKAGDEVDEKTKASLWDEAMEKAYEREQEWYYEDSDSPKSVPIYSNHPDIDTETAETSYDGDFYWDGDSYSSEDSLKEAIWEKWLEKITDSAAEEAAQEAHEQAAAKIAEMDPVYEAEFEAEPSKPSAIDTAPQWKPWTTQQIETTFGGYYPHVWSHPKGDDLALVFKNKDGSYESGIYHNAAQQPPGANFSGYGYTNYSTSAGEFTSAANAVGLGVDSGFVAKAPADTKPKQTLIDLWQTLVTDNKLGHDEAKALSAILEKAKAKFDNASSSQHLGGGNWSTLVAQALAEALPNLTSSDHGQIALTTKAWLQDNMPPPPPKPPKPPWQGDAEAKAHTKLQQEDAERQATAVAKGLNMDWEAREERRKALGYTVKAYKGVSQTTESGQPYRVLRGRHGGSYGDEERGAFLTDKPVIADAFGRYATYPVWLRTKGWKVIDYHGESYSSHGGNDSQINKAKQEGYTGLWLKNVRDSGGTGDQFVAWQTNDVRSWFARFDPEDMFSGDILAASIGTIKPHLSFERMKEAAKVMAEQAAIVSRIAGPVKINFYRSIPADRFDLSYMEAAGDQVGDTLGGMYLPASDVIALAFGDPSYDPLTVAGHEAWHRVFRRLATDQEKALLESPAALEQMRRYAGPEVGGDASALPDEEVMAYAFQRYRREREEGAFEAGRGLHVALRRLFDRVRQFLRRVKNALQGAGFQSYEDIFEAARTGKMAGRSPRWAYKTELGAAVAIASPAVQGADGKIYTGANHGEAAQRAWNDGAKIVDDSGFTTSDGNFVNRRTAFDLAEKSGQIDKDVARKRRSNQETNLSHSDLNDPSILAMGIASPPPKAPDIQDKINRAGNINLDKLDASEDIKDWLRDTAAHYEGFAESRGGRISHARTREMADAIGMDPTLLAKKRKKRALPGMREAEMLAVRDAMVAAGEQIKKLAAKAKGGSDEDKAALIKARARAGALADYVAGETAYAGRLLNQFKIVAGNREMLDTMLESQGDNLDMFIDRVMSLDDPAKIARFSNQTLKPTWWDKIMEVWINSLLSGPVTHATNILSNTLVALYQVPESLIAASISKVTGSGISLAEPVVRMHGLMEGIPVGLRAGIKAFLTEEPSWGSGKIESRRYQAIPGLAGKIVRTPGRALLLEDEVFKAINYAAEINAQALRLAQSEGLSGSALIRRVAELRNNPTERMINRAIAAAEKNTFTNKAGWIAQLAQQAVRKAPFLKFIVPFIRTPANIVTFALRRSALAPLFKDVQADLRGDNGAQARDEAIARMAMGSMISAFAVYLAAQGLLTGGGPDDPRERALLYATGWQPYAFKIGKEYYSFQRFEPLSTLLGVAADAYELYGKATEEDEANVAALMVGSIARNLTNKTFLRGVSEMVEAWQDPERYGYQWWKNMSGTVVPTAVAQAARANDPYLREARTVLDNIKSRIPGLRETLKKRYEMTTGEAIKSEGAWGPDVVSPIYKGVVKDNKVARELIRLKMSPGGPGRSISGVDLSPDQYEAYQVAAGKLVNQMVSRVIERPAYQRLMPEKQEDEVAKAMRTARANARRLVMRQYPDLVRQIRARGGNLRDE
jgi:predicted kinase